MGTSGTQLGRVESGAVEHRLSPRKRVLHPVSLELPRGKEVWLHDLSLGGLRVRGGSRLEMGTSATIRFQLPNTDSVIDATGIVAWSDTEGRAGVRFTQISPESTVALRGWLNSTQHAAEKEMTPQNDAILESRIASLAEVSELQADICRRQLDRDSALALVVRRMTELTRANGAAIALREGEDVICRASAGNAPDVGVKLSLSSLSGECFRTGAMVLLGDSETDPRVDPAICRQLSFRSLLVLPITSNADVVGIAEVLSPNPRNFEGGDVLVLSFLSDLIASIAAPPALTDTNSPTVPGILDAVDEELSEVSSATGNRSTLLEPPVTDLEIRSSEGVQPDEVAAAPALETPDHAASIGIQRMSSSVVVRVPSRAIPPRIAEEQSEVVSPRIESPYSGSSDRRGTTWILSIVAALAGLLISVGLLFSYHRRNTSVTTSNTVHAATSVPASPLLSSPAPTAMPVAAPPISSGKSSKQAIAQNPDASVHTRPQQTENSPSEIRVISGQSAKRDRPSDNNAPEAPQIAQLGGSPLNTLPASLVTAKTPNPQLQVVQSQGVTGGKLLKRVMPRYPDEARRAGISGDVVMAATIGTDGTLHNLKVVSGSPVLREEALAAARQWRYMPAMLSGKPVETDTRITISFHHQ